MDSLTIRLWARAAEQGDHKGRPYNGQCWRTPLLQAQRHEAQFAIRISDKQQRRLTAFLLELVDPLLQRVGIGDRLLRHLDHDVARIEALVGGGGLGFDAGDHHALHAVLDLVTLAQVVGHIGEVEAERLLHDGLFRGRRILVGRQRRLFFAVFKTAELHGAAFFPAFSYDEDIDILADRRIGDDARQVFHLLDVLAVELDDDIPSFDARRLRRPLFVDAGHQRAARRLDVEAVGDIVGDLLDAHAKPAASRLAELAQLVDNRNRGLGRHREPDADGAARRRDDRRVDSDDLAFEIEQRTARIAPVDGGVGLDVIVIRPRIDVAVARRYVSGRDGTAEVVFISDRYHPFTKPQLFRVTELDRCKRFLRLDPQQGKIDLGVAAENFSLETRTVIEDDGHLVGIGDDVIIGHHDSGRIDDEAGAQRIDAARPIRPVLVVVTLLTAAIFEELVEEFLEWRSGGQRGLRRRAIAPLDALRCRDVDDCVDDLFGHISDVVRAASLGWRRNERNRRHDSGSCRQHYWIRRTNKQTTKTGERKASHGRQVSSEIIS